LPPAAADSGPDRGAANGKGCGGANDKAGTDDGGAGGDEGPGDGDDDAGGLKAAKESRMAGLTSRSKGAGGGATGGRDAAIGVTLGSSGAGADGDEAVAGDRAAPSGSLDFSARVTGEDASKVAAGAGDDKPDDADPGDGAPLEVSEADFA
jgi:hypothetical protein